MTKVVGYRNDESASFCTLRLSSGDRVMISVARAPSPSVQVVKLALGGLIPTRTLWEFSPSFAGGYEPYIRMMIAMFADPTGEPKQPLDGMRDALLDCESIQDLVSTLIRREQAARQGQATGGPTRADVTEAINLVQRYAAVMEATSTPAMHYGAPESLLPASRDGIKAAIKIYALALRPLDEAQSENLRIAYMSLAGFIRDDVAARGKRAYAALLGKNPNHPDWALLDEAIHQYEIITLDQQALLNEFNEWLEDVIGKS
jgi:hypothetical protein